MADDKAAREFHDPTTFGQRDPQQRADRQPQGGTVDGRGPSGTHDRSEDPFEGKGMGDLNDSIVGEEE